MALLNSLKFASIYPEHPVHGEKKQRNEHAHIPWPKILLLFNFDQNDPV